MSDNVAKKHFLSETFLVFLVPVYAYVLMYAYESGYFFRLAIPAEFIEVKIPSLAGVSIFVILNFFLIMGSLDILYKIVTRGKDAAVSTLVQLYYVVLCGILPIIALGLPLGYLLAVAIPFVLLVILRFGLPAVKHKEIKRYWDRVEKAHKRENRPQSTNIYDEFARRIGLTPMRISLLLFSFLLGSFFIGAIKSNRQQMFLVINTNPEQVILRINHNSFLCADFNREKKELVYKFHLLTLDQFSQGAYSITPEKVGPLGKPIDFRHR